MWKKKDRVSHSYVVGIIAFVFLVIGYQTALFVHKAAVAKIVSNRDSPDTVYVVDRDVARDILENSGIRPESIEKEIGGAGPDRNVPVKTNPDMNAPGKTGPGRVRMAEGKAGIAVRKEAEHSPEAKRIAGARREVRSFRFDPNTVSVDDLQLLGFTLKQARSIDNYRKKGGRFRRKSDFAKSFVVSDSIYRRLEPFIDIPLLDINLADSAAFDALPGIGGYFASRMVAHRKALGGSYSYKEQLMDIYRFDRAKFDALQDLVTVGNVRPYPLWTLPEDSLKLHPYVGKYAAHGIVVFRENNPPEDWTVQALASAGIIKPEFAEKLSKCVIEEPQTKQDAQ